MGNKMIIAETDRLILRRYSTNDIDDLYEYLSNSNVVEFEPYKPFNKVDIEKELEWRISSDEFIAVELKNNHKMIGNIYLGKRDFNSIELGYVFNDKYWKMGYAKESCKKLINDAFSNGVHRIFAECDPKNLNSWMLLEKLGFVKEGLLKENVYFWVDENNNPIWKDTLIYGKVNKDIIID